MHERKFKDTPAPELEKMLREAFKAHRDIIEELIVRGWEVGLSLPTEGMSNNWGYSPHALGDNAGYVVSRAVGPSTIAGIIKNDRGQRERFR